MRDDSPGFAAMLPENTNAADSLESAANLFGGRPPNRATHTVIGTLRPTDRWRAANQFSKSNGAEGDRTPDLCSAIAALSQLSYSPATRATDCTSTSRPDPSHRIKAKAPRNNAGPLLHETSGSALKVKTQKRSHCRNSLPRLTIATGQYPCIRG